MKFFDTYLIIKYFTLKNQQFMRFYQIKLNILLKKKII